MTVYTFSKTCYITFNTINFYIYIVNSCCILCNISCISINFYICCINTFAIIYDSLCINSDVLSIVCNVSSIVFYLNICFVDAFTIIYNSLCVYSDVLSIVCDVSSIIFYLTIDISDLSFNIVDNCRGLTHFAFQFINSFSVDIDILSIIFNSNLVVADKLTVFKSNCASYINIFCILIYPFS